MSLASLLRYVQGERRGMGSQLKEPKTWERDLVSVLYPEYIFASVAAIATSVHLADVSFWQADIDFPTMRAAGLSGVIIRAGQRNWEDSKFRVNWSKAKLAGLPRGSYFFYDSRETPKKQAELWWSLLQDDPGELVHAADLEESYGGAYGTKGHFKEFINWFQDFSKLPDSRIAAYTGYFWWLQRVGNDPFFKRFPLWLAWYGLMPDVRVPAPWTESELLFWQYTGSGDGSLYGVGSREIDLNWYSGNADSFAKRFGLGAPEPEEPNMAEDKYFKVTASVLNLRSAPVVDPLNDIGDLLIGDIVHAVEVTVANNVTWHQIEGAVYRGGRWANFSTPSPTGKFYAAEKGSAVWMIETSNPTPSTDTVTADIDMDLTVDLNGQKYHTAVMLSGVQLKPVE